MAFVKKAYYRGFQAVFNVGARCLYWRRPIPVSGVGSVQKIPELLGKEKVQKVMVVTGPTVGKKLAPKILTELDKAGIAYTLFAEVEANPSVKLLATNMTEENLEKIAAAGVPKEQFLATQGHIVIRVAPGGDSYRVAVLDDRDTKYRVKAVFGPFPSK